MAKLVWVSRHNLICWSQVWPSTTVSRNQG